MSGRERDVRVTGRRTFKSASAAKRMHNIGSSWLQSRGSCRRCKESINSAFSRVEYAHSVVLLDEKTKRAHSDLIPLSSEN